MSLVHEYFGFFLMGLSLYAAVVKGDRTFIIFNSITAVGWGVNFLLIDAYAAATVDFLIFIRTIIAMNVKSSVVLCNCFIVIFAIAGALTYVGLKDIFPVLATMIATFAFFHLVSWKLRLVVSLSGILWIIHNVMAGSVSGAIHKIIQVAIGTLASYTKFKSERCAE